MPIDISRQQLEALVRLHLEPALDALRDQGVQVVLVAAPLADPIDGRAVMYSSVSSMEATIRVLEQLLSRLRAGRAFDMPGNIS